MGNDQSSRKLENVNKEDILKEVSSYPVVCYTKPRCGYCKMAKDIFEQEKVAYKETNLDEIQATKTPEDYQAYVNGLIYTTRQQTVPQIFICGKFIGGYTELNEIREKKRLWGLVNECADKTK